MALPNLKGMTKAQLDAAMKEISERRAEIEKETLSKVREQIDGVLKKNGLKLEDVFPRLARQRKGAGSSAAAKFKYRDPKDPSKVWSGRGKRPQWFKDALGSGVKPESLLAK
ncbi:H-NS family nucleoid-associated regulatory protein [Metallibacterium scheffleri]|uniref:DNA-binding protein H-NS-like C-terminal domain-containing protein n=1 Tax=Metallibacterium scheffleri TaxID=993689 RepID=A0A4V3UTD0_9GAMM|nr:H-NS histone family protein [Metallibacterium scheffleri]THD10101.1 hypothetical protein B1806_09530 [Metallibacterium scheffleri]